MVSVSVETPEQTDDRLRQVLAAADFVVHEGIWVFEETPLSEPPRLSDRVLAVVRDAESWSALAAASDDSVDRERFGLFSFHFPAGVDNSGFVGWLATHLKRGLGAGVFVVCGSNGARGGIYDYWGVPAAVLDDAATLVRKLRGRL